MITDEDQAELRRRRADLRAARQKLAAAVLLRKEAAAAAERAQEALEEWAAELCGEDQLPLFSGSVAAADDAPPPAGRPNLEPGKLYVNNQPVSVSLTGSRRGGGKPPDDEEPMPPRRPRGRPRKQQAAGGGGREVIISPDGPVRQTHTELLDERQQQLAVEQRPPQAETRHYIVHRYESGAAFHRGRRLGSQVAADEAEAARLASNGWTGEFVIGDSFPHGPGCGCPQPAAAADRQPVRGRKRKEAARAGADAAS